MATIEMPTARLTTVSPAAGPASVHIVPGESAVAWTGTDGIRWEAYREGDAYAVYAPDGQYGLDEEDYALVPVADLLDVIAHGLGDGRR